MAEANLLVSFDPVHQESAKAEIEALMKEIQETVKILKVEEGLAELSVKNARKVIKSLAKISGKDISKFKYTFNWWPVDEWCKSGIADMQKCIKKLQGAIKKEEKWKMDLAKRKTTKDYGKDIIIKLTDVVDKPKVDLKDPDKIIKVEITGNKTAISILAKDDFLALSKLKE